MSVSHTLTTPPHCQTARGFTLVELVAVMGIIAVLLSLLLPGLSAARGQANTLVCQSNIRQIAMANALYAEDHTGTYCPGASEFQENLHRWHGTRTHTNQPFDPAKGPLVPYLGPDGAIQRCPAFPLEDALFGAGRFEKGSGAYGYNNAFLGMQLVEHATGVYEVVDDKGGTLLGWIARPSETLMFADTAFAGARLIEYSFAEPRYHPQFPTFRADPSIHFRHRGFTNVAWCDGHVDVRKRTFTWRSGFYTSDPARVNLGWFGVADDNRLFDLK